MQQNVQIGWQRKSHYREARCAQRYPISFDCFLMGKHAVYQVVAKDLSSAGMRVAGRSLPDVGQDVMVRGRGIAVEAEVVWRSERSCGLKFAQEIDPLHVVRCNVALSAGRAVPLSQIGPVRYSGSIVWPQ